MISQTLITISTVERSYTLSLTKLMRRFVFSIIAVIFLLIAVGFSLSYWLQNSLIAQEKHKEALEQVVDKLRSNIVDKNSSLEELEELIGQYQDGLQKIDELEQLVGINTPVDTEQDNTALPADIDKRIMLARQKLIERQLYLYKIPNGRPFSYAKIKVTSGYGMRIHPVTGKRHMHYGIDYRLPIGTEIKAPADGVIEFAGLNRGGYGKLVRVQHSYGFQTKYGHLSKILVKRGQYVRKGSVIAKSGNTGISTGPHLHYEVEFLRRRVNPKNFVLWNMDNYESLFINEEKIPWAMLLTPPIIFQKLMEQQSLLTDATLLEK